MRKFLIPVFGALCFFPFNVQAWSYGAFISCNGINPKPVVTFAYSYGKLVHDLSTPQKQISAMANDGNPKEPGWETMGLATRPTTRQINFESATVRRLDKKYSCLLPKEIEIFIGYQDPTIYVSKEYNKQSCEFSLVIRHEQTHQRINKLTLEYFLPLMEKAVRQAIYDVRAIKVETGNEAQIKEGFAELRKYYHARLDPIFEEFSKALKTEHAKLDSLASYKEQWEYCRDYRQRHPDAPQEFDEPI